MWRRFFTGEELQPAVLAAKVRGYSVALGRYRRSLVDSHPANRINGHALSLRPMRFFSMSWAAFVDRGCPSFRTCRGGFNEIPKSRGGDTAKLCLILQRKRASQQREPVQDTVLENSHANLLHSNRTCVSSAREAERMAC
jgi:hypothetical protein